MTKTITEVAKIKEVKTSWDLEKKTTLVALGSSDKDYAEILVYIENEIKNSERMTNFRYSIPCFRNDGIYQLNRSIEETIGASTVSDSQKPSGGKDGMNTIDITLANGVRKKVPYGDIALPGMGEGAIIQIYYDENSKNLSIKGKCQFKFQNLIDKMVDRTIELLHTDSIYKCQAFEINQNHDYGQPKILDLSSIDEELMILSAETEEALSPLTARILHPQHCRDNKIPIKFGAILEGPYGTGKTLLAFKLAKQAIENNYSAIYLKSPELLADTLRMAKTLDKNGNGILVFVEDIDQVTKGERDSALQDILNTLDGGDTKNMNVISLFTTNHLELIEPTFLRGKRIGTIISMTYLDAITAEKYISSFCQDVTLEGDFEPVHKLIAESSIAPAFMAEIIENVKTNMILRNETIIRASSFITCIKSYLRQVELSKTKDTSVTKEMALALALKGILYDESYQEDAVNATLKGIRTYYDEE